MSSFLRHFAISLSLALTVFAVVLGVVGNQLRGQLRQQVIQRESESLHAVIMMQQTLLAEASGRLGVATDEDDLFTAALQTSRLRGVLSLRLFSADGSMIDAVPAAVPDSFPDAAIWERLQKFEPVGRLRPRVTVSEIFLVPDTNGEALDLMEVWTPLAGEQAGFAGATQFLMDGQVVSEEFAAIDRSVATLLTVAFLLGGLLLAAVIGLSLGSVERQRSRLRAKTEELARANRDLTLSAKTSALGAVAAHLMHGLRSPLAGLETLTESGDFLTGEAFRRDAARSARRLRSLVDEVMAILREEQTGLSYEVTAGELLGMLERRLAERAMEKGVLVQASFAGVDAALPSRVANFAYLILTNLLENAIDASHREQRVLLKGSVFGSVARFEVTDCGPGLPDVIQANLFQPCISSKAGGGGLGLAISAQLARKAGATLQLERTGPDGTTFALEAPLASATGAEQEGAAASQL
jgi:signal transduction histidine kinase